MDRVRLATISLNQTPLDWPGNQKRILASLDELKGPDPDILCFPELSVSGYGCEDTFHSEDLLSRSFKITEEIAVRAKSILPDTLIFLGLPLRHKDQIFNCMAACYCGEIIGIVPKQNLAGDGVHYEPRWFSAWRGGFTETDDGIPFGSIIFMHGEARVALEICEDAWVSTRPARIYAKESVDIILNPSASHFSFGKQETRKNIARESSRQFGNIFASVNLLGCEAGRIIYDGGSIAASNGELIYESRRFSFKDFISSVIDLDISSNRTARSRIYSRKEERQDFPGEAFLLKTVKKKDIPQKQIGFSETGTQHRKKENRMEIPNSEGGRLLSREEEFAKSVTLGLFDYLRKTKSGGYVVSLSGGVDSSTCALLVQRMLFYPAAEIGLAHALERLGLKKQILENLGGAEDIFADSEKSADFLNDAVKKVMPFVLHTIYQSAKNSGEITRKASSELAGFLGADHYETSVAEPVEFYTKSMEKLIGRKLTWETDDLPLQNIQARARSPLAWMLANVTGSLLITTSNRSEAAVGYCTMDGDTSGGLAPLAGVDKAYLKKWLLHMEKNGDEAGRIEILKLVNEQAPTAELRPPEENQSDENDLMPYDLLDIIERLAIRDRKSPLAIYRTIRAEKKHPYANEPSELKKAISRFFRLWSVNQWKRERYAISFHLDDESLDPKNWYRFPVLNGGYVDELKDLDDFQD